MTNGIYFETKIRLKYHQQHQQHNSTTIARKTTHCALNGYFFFNKNTLHLRSLQKYKKIKK